MRNLRNLPLAVRLGGAFGLVALLLLAVAVVGVSRVQSVRHQVDDLSQRTLRATTLLAEMNDSTSATAAAVVRHLYVFDGDLKAQDAVARQIDADIAVGAADGPRIAALVKGTAAAAPLSAANAGRVKFHWTVQSAVKRSRQETVDGAENRAGSRTYYEGTVLPAGAAAAQAAAKARHALSAEAAQAAA